MPGAPRRIVAAAAALLLGATLFAAAPGATAAPHAPQAPTGFAGQYHAVTPKRVLDTRGGGALGPGQTRTVDLSSVITEKVDSAVLNVTAVNATSSGYLTVYPQSAPRPTTSSLQHVNGEARSSSVTVGVTDLADGRKLVNIYNFGGTTDVVVDVFGYYLADVLSASTLSSYYPLPQPSRLFDSRSTIGPLVNGQTLHLNGTARIGSTNYLQVAALAVNLTVVDPGGPGYLQAWNGDGPAPVVSNVNFVTGRTTPNFAVVPVVCHNPLECSDYSFAIRNVSAAANVVVDVVGFYAQPGQAGGSVYEAVTPYRVVDTRTASPYGKLGPGATGVAPIGDSAGTSAVAANLTVTAVAPSATTYLTVYPDAGTRPVASTLNPTAGQTVANATQTRVTNLYGSFRVFNAAGSTNVVVDVNGAFYAE